MKPMNNKGQQMSKVIFGTVIGIMVLIFGIFGVLFGISTLNPSSFFTASTPEANATSDLTANLTVGVSNFGARIPTVLLVLGVVFVLVAIVLLIAYVKRMESVGGGGGNQGL